MRSVVFKIAVALVLIICAFAVARIRNTRREFAYSASLPIILTVLVRLSIFILVYYVLGAAVPSDVRDFYYLQAKAALAGGVWNLDFPSSYSPLFPYVGAGLLVAYGALAFVMFALCLDILTLWSWNRFVAAFDPKAAAEVSIAYALSAPVILNSLVGQQQIWIGAGLAVSAYLLVSHKTAASGLVQGLILCTAKVLAVLFWPVLFAASNQRTRWVASVIIAPTITAIIFAFLGADLFRGIRAEQLLFTSGNAMYYLDYFFEIGAKTAWGYDIITFIVLFAVSVIIIFIFFTLDKKDAALNANLILYSIALLSAMFMITSKKSYANYLAFAYFPLLFVLYKGLSAKGFFGAWSLLSLAGSAQASLWFANGGNGYWLKDWINKAGWSAVLPSLITEFVLLILYAAIAGYTLAILIRRARMRDVSVRQPACVTDSPSCNRASDPLSRAAKDSNSDI